MRDSGIMTKLMDMELTNMQTEQPMSVIGSKISNTAKVLKSGQMVLSMKETTRTVRKTVMVVLHLLMEVTIQDSLRTMKFQVLESTYGPMVKCMKDNGKRIRCTGKELWSGEMVNSMKVTS